MSTTADTSLLALLVDQMESSGRWRHINAPTLCWIDLQEAATTGENERAYDMGTAIQRELVYEGIY